MFFINKNTTENDLLYLSNGDDIAISKDVALSRDMLDFLFKKYSFSKITILSGYDEIYASHRTFYNEEETKILADNANYIKETYNKELSFDDEFSVKDAILASRKINNIVKEVNSATVKGKPLSPFEKFMMAYRIVTERLYREVDDGESLSHSRNLISVLNGDKIVCAGFANLLSVILNRLDIPCTTECVVAYDKSKEAYGNHATCIVRLVDPKYNIDGIYYSDPTTDSAVKKNNSYGFTSFNSALVRFEDVSSFAKKPIRLDKGLLAPDIKTIKEVDESAITVEPILADLFPEKTGGKSQNILIRESAEKDLKEKGIPELVQWLIQNISEKQVKEGTDELADHFFNSSRLCYEISNGQLDIFLENLINSLHYNGYKNQEIIDLIDKFYSPEKIKEKIRTHYRNRYRGLYSFDDSVERRMQREIKETNYAIQELKTKVATIEPTYFKKHLTDEMCVARILKNISSYTVRKQMFNDDIFDSSFAGLINFMLSNGHSLEDIKTMLLNGLKTVSFGDIYFEECDEEDELYKFSNINEQELYSGHILIFNNIYNKPYLEDFERLKKSARFISQEDFKKAGIQYFLSEDFDYKTARFYTETMLRLTNIVEPKKKD